MQDGRELAAELFSRIVGEKVRNVKLGHGSFITMDFGKDVTVEVKTNKGVDKFNRGEWHLWVYMAAWRLDQGDKSIIGANDERDEIIKRLQILENKKLMRATILNSAFDALVEFQDNLKLHLFSFIVNDSEQWMLFAPDRQVFTAGPGNTWTFEPGYQRI